MSHEVDDGVKAGESSTQRYPLNQESSIHNLKAANLLSSQEFIRPRELFEQTYQ